MSVNLSPVAGAAAQFLDNSGNVLTGGKLYTYLAGTTTPAATYTSSTGVTFHANPIILDAAGRVPSGGEIWLSDNIQYKFVLKDANEVLIATWDNLSGINSNFVNYTVQEEVQTATAGQTVFNLTTLTYAPGTNSLSVFVDGVNQYEGSIYSFVETNATRVTFTAGLHVGALVKFTTAISTTGNATSANVVTFTGFKSQSGVVQDIADDDGSNWIGFEPAGTGAVAMSVQDKLREIVSVKDFGAVGDGVADDTVAFTNAIAAIDALGGGVLYAPATYNIPNGIVITSNNFVLDGQYTGKFLSTGTTNDAILVDSALDNVIVQNLSIEIPTSNLRYGGMCLQFNEGCTNVKALNVNTLGGVAGIWFISGTNVLVQGCYVDTPKADGIHFGHGSKQCKAIGNTVIQAGDDSFATTYYDGFAAGRPTDIVFANNIAKNSIWGFGVAAYGADRVTIIGNEFYNMALGGVQITDRSGSPGTTKCTDVVIANNNIDTVCLADVIPESYWYGTNPALDPAITSQLQKSALVLDGSRVQCVGNRVNTVNSTASNRRIGCTLYSNVSQVSVTSNYFTNINGVGIDTFTGSVNQISLCNNIMDSVQAVGIRCVSSAISGSFTINGNSFGVGQTLDALPYMITVNIYGTLTGKMYITNNTSSDDNGVLAIGTLTNVVQVNNNP